MKGVIKIGRLFYGISIVALGIHQLIIKNFRSEILSPFPAWAHSNIIFPILTGIALIFAGIIISGLFQIKFVNTKKTCLYLGFSFLVALIASHLPYILILSAGKTLGLQPWIDAAEELAYSGGAFVMAGSFSDSINKDENNRFTILLEKLIPFGGIFYSVLMILFGVSHFLFAAFIATLVPKWLPFPMFWTYFFGIALIISGISIIFKIGTKPISLLLAFMLLLFFLFFHIPEAISNPSTGGGNEIVRAFVALLFCGIALGIASTNNPKRQF
ncbi:hypothetical protein [Flavobacterium sp.]|uniref:hypothetical protein n=1 Tax=Flavobacterium sp. TaxID=239 RepID=UPI002BE3B306|nr:hypothetical protein [Flavobacterium sp.]HSD05972.1 hypothetical protein [Flavobacterium sp.]